MKPFWNTRKLNTLRALVGNQTTRELAEYFNTSINHIEHTLKHFDIKRTPEQVKYVQGKINLNGNQAGENNGNWKGGIAKNNYHYKCHHVSSTSPSPFLYTLSIFSNLYRTSNCSSSVEPMCRSSALLFRKKIASSRLYR